MDDIRRLLKNLKSSIFGIFNFAIDLSEANFFGEILILSKKYRFLVVPQTETLARKKKISKIGPFLVKLCVVLLSATFFWDTLYIQTSFQKINITMTIYLIIEKIFIINSLRFKQLYCKCYKSFTGEKNRYFC